VINNYILADNQDVTRAGLVSFLKEANEHALVTEVASCHQLLDALRRLPLSVVVVDYSLFDFLSVHHMLNIKSGARKSAWLLFSDEPEDHFLRQVLMGDPTISVALKNNSKAQLLDALQCITAGEVYWCDYAESDR